MKKLKFAGLKKLGGEGLILLGCGESLDDWVNGVTGMLNDAEIVESADPKDVWADTYELTTTGGRTDIALMFGDAPIEIGKLAMWRLAFGDCSWASDYLDNYADQH